ncbi:MAG: single-stranded-DNA-specific exonuclease RecJ [Oligoflexia bacterium]|nr:single-stranded-DNA-specific exonuclease RecJ [Oligoflexia bacterium]
MPKCSWSVRSGITDEARDLSKRIGLSPVVSQVLINRGIKSPETASEFLSSPLNSLPDPFGMSDMDRAAGRLASAIINKEKICVYGDYDIDGTAAIVIMLMFLRQLGCDAGYYQPGRFDEGYGLHIDAVREIIKSGVDLLVSVDCGTSNYDTAAFCLKEGIDLIITDHHKIGDKIPEAYAFVNPHRGSEGDAAFTRLAGVGVAYYLLIATRKLLRDRGFFTESLREPNLKEYLDIVALGTVADVVPLKGVNRVFVKNGLDSLNCGRHRKGLKALLDASGLKTRINTEAIGYILAPRLNAAGRMGNATRAVELMLSDDIEHAAGLACELNEENNRRISFQNRVWNDVCLWVEKQSENEAFDSISSLVFAAQGWHQGVVGIVASKAVDRWYRPTAVFSLGDDGIAKGSARSIDGVDLFEIISEFGGVFEKFGGHSMAAGMSLKTERLDRFRELFENGVAKRVDAGVLKPVLDIDLEIRASDISMKTVNEISSLEPFGYENPAPLFLSRNVNIVNKWLIKDKHIKLRFADGTEAIGFNMPECADTVGSRADIVYIPMINEWNGTRRLQFKIVDVE